MNLSITLDDNESSQWYKQVAGVEESPLEITVDAKIYHHPAEPSLGVRGETEIEKIFNEDIGVIRSGQFPTWLDKKLHEALEQELEEQRYESELIKAGL